MERLTTRQASEILGVSRRRVIALIEQGKLKAERFASVYTIDQKDLEAVRHRKNGRPPKTGNADLTKINQKPFKTIFDVAPELVGCLDSGLGDLSTNKKYMEGFGTKEGEKRGLLKREKNNR